MGLNINQLKWPTKMHLKAQVDKAEAIDPASMKHRLKFGGSYFVNAASEEKWCYQEYIR